MSPVFIRVAAFRQPSSYDGNRTSLNQTLECDISFTAYKYFNASSTSNQFSIENTETIALDDAYVTHFVNSRDQGYVTFNTSGLPEFKVSIADIGALLLFFPSSSFSGMLLEGEDVPTYSDGIATALGRLSTNLTTIFENIAGSMTNELRSRYNTTAYGLTATTVVVVHVRWAWLVPPAVVVLASAVVLVAGMYGSRAKADVAIWKTSSTALLFHSVSLSDETMRAEFESPEQLKERIKDKKVKLT